MKQKRVNQTQQTVPSLAKAKTGDKKVRIETEVATQTCYTNDLTKQRYKSSGRGLWEKRNDGDAAVTPGAAISAALCRSSRSETHPPITAEREDKATNQAAAMTQRYLHKIEEALTQQKKQRS